VASPAWHRRYAWRIVHCGSHAALLIVCLCLLVACRLPAPPSYRVTRSRIITPPTRDMRTPTATSTATLTPTPNLVPTVYVVRRGDTLTRIARAFGVSVSDLRRANNIVNPNRILVGQRLVIPVASPGALALAETPTAPSALTAEAVPTATATFTPRPPTPTETSTATPTATYTPTATDTATATPTATSTSTSTAVPTATATGTSTATPTYTMTPTATATETATPTDTATPTQEVPPTTPIAATPTATVVVISTPTPAPTATPSRSPTPATTATGVNEAEAGCEATVENLLREATVRTLPSGARILVPKGWHAEERSGLGEPLPYLSDEAVSIAISLVVRRQGTTVADNLELVASLTSCTETQEVLREIDENQNTGVVVWDELSGGQHHVLAGYVGPRYVGIMITTLAFCPKESPYSQAEAEPLAAFLQTLVASYREAGQASEYTD